MELEAALENAQVQLNVLLSQKELLDRSIEELQVEVAGLQRAIERHGGASIASIKQEHPVIGMDRTGAVEYVLKEIGGTLSPAEIQQLLHAAGRDDPYNAVSAALAHLARTGRAHAPERGQWAAGPDPNPSDEEGALFLAEWEAEQEASPF